MVKKGVLTESEKERFLKLMKTGEEIEREVNISWDGSNLLIRIPKEIADYLGINKDNRFENKIKFTIKEMPEGVEKRFEIVKRSEPKRKWRKKKK